MRDAGYDSDFAVGITAASSTIGPIIPPSLPLVVFGVVGNTSIGQLFAAGLIPGFVMAVSLMLMVAWFAWRRGYPRDERFRFGVFWRTFADAILPLFTPIIIVGGILSGMFTPTEAAIAAVAYALFLGLAVYRTLNWQRIMKVSLDTLETTAAIMMIVAASALFAWILTANQVAVHFAQALLGFTDDKAILLLLIMLIILVIGCFMETLAAITILTPVLLPVADVSFERCVIATAPFLIPLVAVLLLLTFVSEFSMWLPTLIYR